MQATREKTPDTHATALATWAPIAAPSEGCFRLAGLLTAAHLRDLRLELQNDRGGPHRAHGHSGDAADGAWKWARAVTGAASRPRPMPTPMITGAAARRSAMRRTPVLRGSGSFSTVGLFRWSKGQESSQSRHWMHSVGVVFRCHLER